MQCFEGKVDSFAIARAVIGVCVIGFLCNVRGVRAEEPVSAGATGFSAERLAGVQALQQELIDTGECLSNVGLVAQNGKVVYRHAAASRMEGDRPITDETLFPIWSMTKPITSVAAMILYERGAFQLDDPVAEVIPVLGTMRVAAKEKGGQSMALTRPITYRHLLLHTSGLYGYDGSFHEEGTWKEIMELESLAAVVDLLATQPLRHQPGERHTYGMSTAVLGRAVEVLSKQSLAEFFEKELFGPLGMRDTRFHLTEEDRQRFHPLFVKEGDVFRPGTAAEDELYYKPGSALFLGGEGLVSTVGDYAKFCQMLVDGGRGPEGKQIIKEETLAMMVEDHLGATPGRGGEENPFKLGFGFSVLKGPVPERLNWPVGIYDWGGYHNTIFWIDPKNRIYGIFMSRRYPASGKTQDRFRTAVYEAFGL